MVVQKKPAWVYQGKPVRQLIKELGTFEDQNREVLVSIDYGDNRKPIGFVEKKEGYYLLSNYEESMGEMRQAQPECVTRGRTIQQLTEELRSLENQELEVRISINYDENHKPISLVEKNENYCVLVSCSDFYNKKLN